MYVVSMLRFFVRIIRAFPCREIVRKTLNVCMIKSSVLTAHAPLLLTNVERQSHALPLVLSYVQTTLVMLLRVIVLI